VSNRAATSSAASRNASGRSPVITERTDGPAALAAHRCAPAAPRNPHPAARTPHVRAEPSQRHREPRVNGTPKLTPDRRRGHFSRAVDTPPVVRHPRAIPMSSTTHAPRDQPPCDSAKHPFKTTDGTVTGILTEAGHRDPGTSSAVLTRLTGRRRRDPHQTTPRRPNRGVPPG
jgi:hypothetical protein